jgi:hypothetical protein
MRRTILVLALAAVMVMSMAGAALAGNGKDFNDCFGTSYGQSGLNYGQLKKDAPHPVEGGYGIVGVLAAHGPEGAIPLGCVGD